MPKPNRQKGFILIELVMTLVLVGIIGAFTSFFIYTGINGFLTSKKTSETALRVQIAMDRISAELRHITALVPGAAPVLNTSITYLSKDLPGTRRIRFDSNSKNLYLSVAGTENILLDNLATFSLTWLPTADLDNSQDLKEEIAAITLSFTVPDVGTPFSVRIYPRNLIPKPL